MSAKIKRDELIARDSEEAFPIVLRKVVMSAAQPKLSVWLRAISPIGSSHQSLFVDVNHF